MAHTKKVKIIFFGKKKNIYIFFFLEERGKKLGGGGGVGFLLTLANLKEGRGVTFR